jgi:hypothetical protein
VCERDITMKKFAAGPAYRRGYSFNHCSWRTSGRTHAHTCTHTHICILTQTHTHTPQILSHRLLVILINYVLHTHKHAYTQHVHILLRTPHTYTHACIYTHYTHATYAYTTHTYTPHTHMHTCTRICIPVSHIHAFIINLG